MNIVDEAARQACGRIELPDAIAIACTALELGVADARAHVVDSRAGVLARALSAPEGAGFRLDIRDMRPGERAAMRALCTRAYAAGRARA